MYIKLYIKQTLHTYVIYSTYCIKHYMLHIHIILCIYILSKLSSVVAVAVTVVVKNSC